MEFLQPYIQQGLDLWNQMGNEKYLLLIFPAGLVLTAFSLLVNNKFDRQRVENFRRECPEASSVILNTKGNFIAPHRMAIHSIDNGEHAFAWSTEKGKYVYWLKPGQRELELSYEKQRPGIFYRTVTTTYGPTKVSVKVEANKRYEISFDSKTSAYSFKEIA